MTFLVIEADLMQTADSGEPNHLQSFSSAGRRLRLDGKSFITAWKRQQPGINVNSNKFTAPLGNRPCEQDN